jgi:glucose dehydrogenase
MTIFVGSDYNKLYAVDALNRTKKWSFETGQIVRSSPAVRKDGTTIFVGSHDNKVYAVDALTGVKKLSFETDASGAFIARSRQGRRDHLRGVLRQESLCAVTHAGCPDGREEVVVPNGW